MNERDIRGNVMALVGAVATKDEKTALQAGMELATQFLVDVNRIANALEVLAIECSSPKVPGLWDK